MLNFFLGFILGGASLYFYSDTVRENVKECNAELKEMLHNQKLLNEVIQEEIRKQNEITESVYQRVI